MRVFLLTLCTLASLSGAIRAQGSKVPVTLFCFRYAPGLQEVFVRIDRNSYRGVTLSSANIIGPVNAAVINGRVTIHQEITDREGVKSWPVIARAKVGLIADPLVVLLPRKRGNGPAYRTFVVDRSKSEFPPGSYQLINFSPYPVRCRVGGRSALSASGTVQKLQPIGVPGKMMSVEFEYHDGERWRRMTTTRWAYRNDRRSLLCLDPADTRMKLRSIPDRVITPATATR